MFFVWGEKLAGKMFRVPGVCYVATVFFHAYFIPLFPYRTYIVVDGASKEIDDAIERGTIRRSVYGFWGVPIPMSGRSVLFGFVRAFLAFVTVVAALVALVPIITTINGTAPKGETMLDPPALTVYGVAAGAGLLFWLTFWSKRADEAKAAELLEKLGLPQPAPAEQWA